MSNTTHKFVADPVSKRAFSWTSQGSTIERFVEKNSSKYKQQQTELKAKASSALTDSIEKAKQYSEQEMIKILEQLCNAYSLNSQSEITKLEPIATAVGIELNRRGGLPKMKEIYSNIVNLKGSRTLEMHWNGVGDWRG